MGRQGITKHPGQRDAARAEAAGLAWLREASDRVVEVLEVTDSSLTTARVAPARPTPEAARRAGRELARIHDAGAGSFGCPPPGWTGLNYIGTQPQACEPRERWADFYVEQRVLPFAQAAHEAGNIDDAAWDTVRRACAAVRDSDAFDAAKPARIHGDLWAGNLLFGADGPAFIDPAAHGGHRETDLAMLDLFGAPFIEEIRAGYEEAHPLPKGWLDFTCVHQLHPLAVHAFTHGPSYGHALESRAAETLDLLG
ncbi:fructosamine kinase family protein [Corynebacterium frankenforstense]|uniref:fructosamine kinase family protein n=1 Tax=Corynebacterium frankenforstense TaxID=1230998 RepID=UPI00254B5DAE|nr:fructosamine kinase family protein [Corynebacterium frankenforstense]MDK6260795.1 fructosamine kinase family protein [Corynebacterium frankenforstense]